MINVDSFESLGLLAKKIEMVDICWWQAPVRVLMTVALFGMFLRRVV